MGITVSWPVRALGHLPSLSLIMVRKPQDIVVTDRSTTAWIAWLDAGPGLLK